MSENRKLDLVLAIDPSSGAKSKCGFVAFDPEMGLILDVQEFSGGGIQDVRKRIKFIALQAAKEFRKWEETGRPYAIFIESTVMMGKSGETLQRAIGAIMTVAPSDKLVAEINVSQVKAFIGGNGRAQKDEVAAGLKKYFPNDPTLPDLIAAHRWDLTDALAIGMTGYEKYIKQTPIGKKKK